MHETEDCDLLCDTLTLADHFAHDALSEACQRELAALVNCQNVCSLLRRADKAMATALKRKCLHFVFENADEVTRYGSSQKLPKNYDSSTLAFEELKSCPSLLMELAK